MLCHIDLISPHTFSLAQLQNILQDAPSEWQVQLIPFFDEYDIKIKNLDTPNNHSAPTNTLSLHLNPGIGEPAIFNGLWAENSQSKTMEKLVFFLLQKMEHSYFRVENRHHDYAFRVANESAKSAALHLAQEQGLLNHSQQEQTMVYLAKTANDLFRPINQQLHTKDTEQSLHLAALS